MINPLLKQIVLPFWSICTLKKGPQDLPVSGLLLSLAFIVGFLFDIINLRLSLPDKNLSIVIELAIVYALSLMLSLSMLMWLLGYKRRIMQTLTALLGAGVIISVFAAPLLLVLQLNPDEPSLFGFLILAINIWNLAVTAHILRFALSISMLVAGILAFGYFLLGFTITNFFISLPA